MGYWRSFFSIKKILFKRISFLCVWDRETMFTKTTNILAFAKLKKVQIGKYSRVGYNCNISNTVIGNFTAIGRNCNIGLGQHPTNYLTTNSIFYKKGSWGFHDDWVGKIDFNSNQPIKIGNDVWIGINCIIMDGVEIGNGAIVAAGSVVTKNVPPYAIVGGVPAKVIKYRLPEEIINSLQHIGWWNLSDEEITKILPLFHSNNLSITTINSFFKRSL